MGIVYVQTGMDDGQDETRARENRGGDGKCGDAVQGQGVQGGNKQKNKD